MAKHIILKIAAFVTLIMGLIIAITFLIAHNKPQPIYIQNSNSIGDVPTAPKETVAKVSVSTVKPKVDTTGAPAPIKDRIVLSNPVDNALLHVTSPEQYRQLMLMKTAQKSE